MVNYLLNIRVFGMFQLNPKVFKNFYLNLLSYFLLTDLNIMWSTGLIEIYFGFQKKKKEIYFKLSLDEIYAKI